MDFIVAVCTRDLGVTNKVRLSILHNQAKSDPYRISNLPPVYFYYGVHQNPRAPTGYSRFSQTPAAQGG